MHRPTWKFIESRDVVFNEGGDQEQIILEPEPDANDSSTAVDSATDPLTSPTPSTPTSSTLTSSTMPSDSRPKRTIRPPIPDDDPCYNISSYGHCANLADAETPEPKTYDEAMASPDAIEWLAACEDEM